MTLLEKTLKDKEDKKLSVQVLNCLEIAVLGYKGSFMHYHLDTKLYCTTPEYCSCQAEKDGPGWKECDGIKLYMELHRRE